MAAFNLASKMAAKLSFQSFLSSLRHPHDFRVEFSWFGKQYETSRGKLFLRFFLHQNMAILRFFSYFLKVKEYVCFNQFLRYILTCSFAFMFKQCL